jgi:excisionase family DNA binding protein
MKIETNANPTNDVMTADEAATYLRISRSQLFDLTRSRANARMKHPIPVLRYSKQLRFRRSSLNAWMETLEKAG